MCGDLLAVLSDVVYRLPLWIADGSVGILVFMLFDAWRAMLAACCIAACSAYGLLIVCLQTSDSLLWQMRSADDDRWLLPA